MSSNRAAFLLRAVICAGVGLMVLSAFLIGVEHDEAWIIASHLEHLQTGTFPIVPRVVTTGGVHLFLIGLLGEPGSGAVYLARGVSFVSFCLLMLLAERVMRLWFPDPAPRLIVLLMILVTPGTLFLGGMGYGIVLATVLLLSGFFFWTAYTGQVWVRIAVTGVLFGLAVATRWTFVPLVVLMALSGAVLSAEIRHRWAQGVAVTALALAVFTVTVMWHSGFHAFWDVGGDVPDAVVVDTGTASGLFGGLPRPARITGLASRYVTLLSFPMVFASLVAAVLLGRQMPGTLRRIILALAAAGLVIALAWVWRSPFLHTRYIWPSVLMINMACGLTLAFAITWLGQDTTPLARMVRLICIVLPLGQAVETYTIGTRLIAAGSGYETNNAGYSSQELHFDAFRLRQEQWAVTEFLRQETGAQDRIQTFGTPHEWRAIQLALLSQRNVEERTVGQDMPVPDLLVTHEFGQQSPAGQLWLDRISRETVSVYGYKLHWIDAEAFVPPEPGFLIDDATYLFSYRKAQSLSGY